MADLPKPCPSHVCHHARFGRSAYRSVGINTEERQKLGSHGTPLSWEVVVTTGAEVPIYLSICLSVCVSIYLKSQDYGDINAGAQQGRQTMS